MRVGTCCVCGCDILPMKGMEEYLDGASEIFNQNGSWRVYPGYGSEYDNTIWVVGKELLGKIADDPLPLVCDHCLRKNAGKLFEEME